MQDVHHQKTVIAEPAMSSKMSRRRSFMFFIAFFATTMLVCASVALAHEQALEASFDEPIDDIPAKIDDQGSQPGDRAVVSSEDPNEEDSPTDDASMHEIAPMDDQGSKVDRGTIEVQADKNVTSSTTKWSNGTYTVSGDVDIEKRVTVSGNVVLQLDRGSRLSALSGINVPSGATLTIKGEGSLFAYADDNDLNDAIIGGNSGKKTGRIVVDSGRIEVMISARNFAGAGIGSGNGGEGGQIVINGGVVNVTSMFRDSVQGAAIGGGAYATDISIEILGGTVSAQAGGSATAIGTGFGFRTASVLIDHARVKAVGYGSSPAIGGQQSNSPNAVSVTILDSEVEATAQGSTPAIGYLGPGKLKIGDTSSSVSSTTLVRATSIDSRCMNDTDDWMGIVFIGNEGTIYGRSVLASDLALEPSQHLSIPAASTLSIPAGVTLEDEGSITNAGTVENEGSIIGAGSFVNTGTIVGNGVFFPQEISFDTQGGSAIPSLMVNKDSLITDSIPDPTREGYAFDGWYRDPAGTTPWDFATSTVTAPLTLFAKWTALEGPSEPSQPEPPLTPSPDVPSDPAEPVEPSDPEDTQDPADEPSKPADDGSNEQTSADREDEEYDQASESDRNIEEARDEISSEETSDSIPKLGDPILVLPIFFGMLGILIVLNLDTFARSRERIR